MLRRSARVAEVGIGALRGFAKNDVLLQRVGLVEGLTWQEILDGLHDGLPEQAFYMVGNIDEAIEKAKKLAAQS